MVDFPNFILQLNDTLEAENGENLAYLLRPTSPHGKALVRQFKNANVSSRCGLCTEGVEQHF